MIKSAIFLLTALFVGSVMAENATVDNNNTTKVSIELTHVANAVQALALNMNLDKLVAQSLHEDDRRFARIG